MSKSFKRAAAAGFTLIELLIVVIILAILAAIAIPQFSASTDDAKLAALDTNLASIRTSIEQYRLQHAGMTRPGVKASKGGTDCTGTAGTGEAGTDVAATDQLKFASNAEGQTCSVADAKYRFGPYLPRGIPAEPVKDSAAIAYTNTTGAISPAADGSGWAYNAGTGQFIMNNSAAHPNGGKYSDR